MKPEDITALKQTIARLVEREITPAMDGFEAAGDFPRRLIEAMGSAGLFVRPEARRLGVGRALMSRIARLAKNRSCVYIEWLVEGGNQAAETFYTAAGAHLDGGKTVYQIGGQALDRLADDEGAT